MESIIKTANNTVYVVIKFSSSDRYDAVVNMTKMFGIGNEPTSTDDPRITMVEQYAVAHQENNPGTLMNFSNSAVVSSTGQILDTSAIVQKYFPDGIKSAGTVHDEIDFDRMVAIQRVGHVDETGFAYEILDTPIETPITEPFDPSIEVESGGTLIFENDQGADFHIPVPNQETFMIKLPGGATE